MVEKAKVVLSGDKSEMVIDLKPEHLGKLELKLLLKEVWLLPNLLQRMSR
ncbi:hypothetical protein [Acetivibrio straminisolvens]|nr:hypothetical protein [Acetivibrio straminisolvens]